MSSPAPIVTEAAPNEFRDPAVRSELQRATVWFSLALAIGVVIMLVQPLLLVFGGLVFAAMLDGGVRLLGRKTVELMTTNHLRGDMAAMGQPRFSESSYFGIGFGLGFSVMLDPAKAQILGTAGEYAWGGAASTAFWIDPVEEMAVIMLTQLMPSSTYPIRRELRVLTYQAVVD